MLENFLPLKSGYTVIHFIHITRQFISETCLRMLTCKGIVVVQQNQDSHYYRSPITIKVDAAHLQRIPWAAL